MEDKIKEALKGFDIQEITEVDKGIYHVTIKGDSDGDKETTV